VSVPVVLPFLDPRLHEPGRLAVASALAAVPSRTFTELREATGLTDGNLGAHLKVLEKARYVRSRAARRPIGRRTATEVSLTPKGRAAFRNYLDSLEAIVKGAGTRGRGG
jgi:DNA-binding MarR family transcriptional regulator